MLKRSTIALATIATCLAGLPVAANVTPMRLSGGQDPKIDGWCNIAMERENVSLKVSPASFVTNGTYWLKNPDRAETRVEVGYPFEDRFPDEMQKFSAWVDDKPAVVRNGPSGDPLHQKLFKKVQEENEQKSGIKVGFAGGSGPGGFKCWLVDFPPLAQRTLKVSYHTFPRAINQDVYVDPPRPLNLDGSLNREDAESILSANGEDVETEYILWTGGRWNGNIKHAVITAEVQSDPEWKVSVTPKASSIVGRTYTWVFKNFKPGETDDYGSIKIKFHPRDELSTAAKAAVYKRVASRHLNDYALCSMIADRLDSLDRGTDSAMIRYQSIQQWKTSDAKKMFECHLDMTQGYIADPAIKMAALAWMQFDIQSNRDCAKRAGQIFNSMLSADIRETDYVPANGTAIDALQGSHNMGWPSPSSELSNESNYIRALGRKYNIDVEGTEKSSPLMNLQDGLYLVLREAESPQMLKPKATEVHVITNDYHFLDQSEKESPTYLAITKKEFIPFTFSSEPAMGKDDKGRTKLLLHLNEDQVKPLENFTRTNCGKTVVIIVGGKVVTTHKIREAITGGLIQITRCSDWGCDVLYSQLKKK